jgi:spore germination protein Q
MVQYYWYPGSYPQQQQQQMTPPNVQLPATRRRQEESYVENILRMNKGKLGTFYFTFEHSKEHNSKVITGYVEAAGRDHVIISDQNGKRYLILMIYFDYATFDEEINYSL